MTLFSSSELRTSTVATAAERARLRITTGPPRLGESSAARRARIAAEAWAALVDVIRRKAQARLVLLEHRNDHDHLPCPWAQFAPCDGDCRCRGRATVSVRFLRAHYARLAIEIVRLARPSDMRRPS